MNKDFLRHYANRNERGVGVNGLRHCHVQGLHSIVLEENPDARIRMFYAAPDHTLYRNEINKYGRPVSDMSLGIHAHRMDITIVPIMGQITNIVATVGEEPGGPLHKFRYKSKIIDGVAGLEIISKDSHEITSLHSKELHAGDEGEFMAAEEMHTIHVYRATEAAWLIFEGTPAAAYQPVCYSNESHFDASRLYKPMTQAEVSNILYRVTDAQ